MKNLVIIPAYNEEGCILNTVQDIIVMYLSANEETKQEIRNVLIYLDSIVKKES